MGLILDTIIYASFLFEPYRLKDETVEFISTEKELYITFPTVWEMSNHIVKGIYNIENDTIEDFIKASNKVHNIKILPLSWKAFNWITATPIIEAHGKPHKDSFDRLIIAHAIVNNLPILSKDRSFRFYAPLGLNFIAVE
jgi:PIN domain nuclease of toxin-antitoxin system